MKISRVWQMPNASTFDIPSIRDFVNRYNRGISVDPFARNQKLSVWTNDIDPNSDADSHLDAVKFLSDLAEKKIVADVVLLDPPYSPRQISENYSRAGLVASSSDTQNALLYKNCKRQIRRICKLGSHVLTFGWNTVGMGPGFEMEEILIVCHGGAHNDTLCVAEKMVQEQKSLL